MWCSMQVRILEIDLDYFSVKFALVRQEIGEALLVLDDLTLTLQVCRRRLCVLHLSCIAVRR
jgi:hypothetical protein